jgi:hypothetical protein
MSENELNSTIPTTGELNLNIPTTGELTGTIAMGELTTVGITNPWKSYEYSNREYTDPKLTGISGCMNSIATMSSTLWEIRKIYKLIDIQENDIFLTMADTGEIFSVNQLVKDSRNFKK